MRDKHADTATTTAFKRHPACGNPCICAKMHTHETSRSGTLAVGLGLTPRKNKAKHCGLGISGALYCLHTLTPVM